MNGSGERRWFGAVFGLVLGAGVAVWWSGRSAEAPVALAGVGAGAPSIVASPTPPAHAWPARAARLPEDEDGSTMRRSAPPAVVEFVDEPRIGAWVLDLRDDGIPGNAGAAQGRLLSLPAGPVPALERALVTDDVQQRHLAARVLRRRCERGEAASPRLLVVTVEALAAWLEDLLGKRRLCRDWNPSAEGTRFLVAHAVAAREVLRRGLASGDAQQRLLCAWLLAQSGDTEKAGPIGRELLPHLGDNDIAGDAVMAANGLFRLGPVVLPTLRWWRQTHDGQARALLDLVIADLERPPRSRADVAARVRVPQVTSIYHDPAIEYDVHRSWVPSWWPR